MHSTSRYSDRAIEARHLAPVAIWLRRCWCAPATRVCRCPLRWSYPLQWSTSPSPAIRSRRSTGWTVGCAARWRSICCTPTATTSPITYLSPLRSGFPPTFLQSGTRDLFLSNTVRLHRKLLAAGVDTELHIFEAMPHAGFGGTTPEDIELDAAIHAFLDKHRRAS